MRLAPDTLLALYRSAQLIPDGRYPDGDSVVIMRSGHCPVRVSMPGISVQGAIEALQEGTAFGDLAKRFFRADLTAAHTFVSSLRSQGLLAAPTPSLAAPQPAEADRLDRLVAYLAEFEQPNATRYEYIDRLRRAHVLFLGLGSMTSWIIGHLVAAGVGRITGIDADRVAASNLARQALLAEADIDVEKTRATEAAVKRLSTLTEFTGVAAQISSAEEAERVLAAQGPINLVILTADQPLWAIAEWASAACGRVGVPLLRANVQGVGPVRLGPGTACPACELSHLRQSPGAEQLLRYRASDRYRSIFNSATISTEIAIQGAVAAHEAVGLLTRAWQPSAINVRLRVTPPPELSASRYPVRPSPDCVACRTAVVPSGRGEAL